MCRPDAATTTTTTTTTTTQAQQQQRSQKPLRLLLSLDSYDFSNHKESSSSSSGGGCGGDPRPSIPSLLLTGSLFLLFLVTVEHALRYYLQSMQDKHPILQDETHRHILARHIGVDALSCLIVALLGWGSRHVCAGPVQAATATLWRRNGGNNNSRHSDAMPAAGHEQRLYTYHPAGFRIAALFFFYQVKNMYDTIVWNDGPEFIFHHVFSLITAWGAMSTGVGMLYAIFFFGLCEISTGVLCLLANFDDQHGVPGLGEALPTVKVGMGALFVVLFLACRVILWPTYSYYFCQDVLQALKINDARTKPIRGWLTFFLISLSGLSVLQVAWLGQIFVIAKEELVKTGFL